MWGHHLCGGQFLGLQQWVETVYDADVQLGAHWAQLHLYFSFPGNGAETNLAALLREAKGWLSWNPDSNAAEKNNNTGSSVH